MTKKHIFAKNNEMINLQCYTPLAIISLSIIGLGICIMVVKIDYGQFGKADEEKLKAFYKTNISANILLALTIVAIVALCGLLDKSAFLLMLGSGLTALGFKSVIDYKTEIKITSNNTSQLKSQKSETDDSNIK